MEISARCMHCSKVATVNANRFYSANEAIYGVLTQDNEHSCDTLETALKRKFIFCTLPIETNDFISFSNGWFLSTLGNRNDCFAMRGDRNKIEKSLVMKMVTTELS